MKTIAKRLNTHTFLKDTIGAMALLAILYIGLWMPAFL